MHVDDQLATRRPSGSDHGRMTDHRNNTRRERQKRESTRYLGCGISSAGGRCSRDCRWQDLPVVKGIKVGYVSSSHFFCSLLTVEHYFQSTSRTSSTKMHFTNALAFLLTASVSLAAPATLEKKQACSPAGISGAEANRVKASFTASGIVPTLVPGIEPRVKVDVSYGNKAVNLGNQFLTLGETHHDNSSRETQAF